MTADAAPPLVDSLAANGAAASASNGDAYVYSQDVHVAGYEPLIAPALLLHETPLSEAGRRTVARGRGEASAVIAGRDDRLVVVVGPCSIHNPEEAIEYGERLVKEMPKWPGLVVIMRAYFESEWSQHEAQGWKSMRHSAAAAGGGQQSC
jgi:3-deoxy-7-phosphoheptulonate synthase